MPNHQANWDFSQITEFIYLGADMCCGISHYDYLTNVMGITADIDLKQEHLDPPSPLLEQFLWLPTLDGHPPTPAQLQTGVAVLDQLVSSHKKVFVHCHLGHGRAPTLVAAYLVSQGLTPEAAIAEIKKHRPEVHLNKEQLKALEKFE